MFKVEEVKRVVARNGRTTRVVAVALANGEPMDEADLNKVHELFSERVGERFYMRAFGATGFPFTLKTLLGPYTGLSSVEDYMQGHGVQDVAKFTDEFFQVHVGWEQPA